MSREREAAVARALATVLEDTVEAIFELEASSDLQHAIVLDALARTAGPRLARLPAEARATFAAQAAGYAAECAK